MDLKEANKDIVARIAIMFFKIKEDM